MAPKLARKTHVPLAAVTATLALRAIRPVPRDSLDPLILALARAADRAAPARAADQTSDLRHGRAD
jgi:hypothetical protein